VASPELEAPASLPPRPEQALDLGASWQLRLADGAHRVDHDVPALDGALQEVAEQPWRPRSTDPKRGPVPRQYVRGVPRLARCVAAMDSANAGASLGASVETVTRIAGPLRMRNPSPA
jgi:hypothetical protein